jgi:dTDP-4-amino-4,6-dideoxygalactose transaminase
VPQVSPGARFEAFRPQIERAIARVYASGRFILGEEVGGFERRFAGYLGAGHAIGVANGTDAITLALNGLAIGPGDEVVTVALTAPATAVGILRAGARVRFADVDARTRCVSAETLEEALTPTTRAIVVVHLHGRPAPMHDLMTLARSRGVRVVEDCAHAHGATLAGRKAGTFGDAAAFSFYPTKNLGAPGDGGAVVTDDPDVAARVRAARQYGLDEVGRGVGFGLNSRLDELHAAVLSELLEELDAHNEQRRRLAARYREALAGLDLAAPEDCEGHVYHQFAIEVDERDDLRRHLAAAGIGTGIHYPLGLQRHPSFAAPCDLPVTDRLSRRLISLPIQPEIAEPHFQAIVDALRSYCSAR